SPAPAASPTAPLPPTIALPTRPAEPAGPTLSPTIAVSDETDADAARALLPAFAADASLSPDLTRYWIETAVDFDPANLYATLRGQERVRYVVPPGEPIDKIPLMLSPNDYQYDGDITVGRALVNGVPTTGDLDRGGVVLWLPLDQPAAPGAVVDLSLPFEIRAGGPIGEAEDKRFGITQGVLAAPTFYPLVPRRTDNAWQVETSRGGDPTNSDTAYYQVDLTVPQDLGLAASGVAVGTRDNADGTVTTRFVSGPMRDFAFTLGPLQSTETTVGGVTVRAWALAEHRQDAGQMLESAARQLATLDGLVGPYPYPELDVVDVPGAFGGIEYPGIVFIGTLGTPWIDEPTVHEVAHQWFYALIGDDQLHEPWLDEAMASYAEVLYFERNGEPARARDLLSTFRGEVLSLPDTTLPIGQGFDDYGDWGVYGGIVYAKGALFLDTLRHQIGDEAFFAFLSDFFQQERYGVATGKEFQQAAEKACSCDLESLFDLWVWQGGQVPGL
ncbi:MAG TPA: M1 family metallopeptidase, partial [Anaerolineales bacterium]|nr:M1 family metallopeptidase [Anaerolineales bacterium]